jgi:glycosyltransferase involved in cell wall biosynthesis
MKKILFLSPLPPPHYGSALSSEACLNILKKDKNFIVDNIKLNYSKSMADVGFINFSKIKGIFSVMSQIKEKVESFNPDLIYFVPATSGLGLRRDSLFVKRLKKYKKKIIFHVRSRITEEDWKKNRKTYEKMFEGSYAIVLGDVLRSDLHGILEKRRLFVLPNAIKNEISDKQANSIMSKRQKRESFNILFLSNMDETKGWSKLLKACNILNREGVKFNCNFVGEFASKTEEKNFNDYVQSNNLSQKVSHLGKKIGKEKNSVLQISDLLVFPTEYKLETFGRVILEGMMFSLPVIANGIASIPSIIDDGKTGFVLKENTPEEIASKIRMLHDNKFLRSKMGKKGRDKFIKEFEIKDYSKKFKNIINSI